MTVSESFKNKYSLSGETYPARNADRAISDLFSCISRLHAEAAAAGERADAAEKQTAALTAETKALIDENRALSEENTELQNTISELQKTNARLIAEAEQLDRRLASVGVTVSANDKKLAESSERLCALVARAEQLCQTLDERTAELCRTFDERSEILCRNAVAPVNTVDKTEACVTAVEDSTGDEPVQEGTAATAETETEIAEVSDIPEPGVTDSENVESVDPTPEDMADEALDEALDPNLFAGDETPAEITPDIDLASDAPGNDEDSVVNALKQAISEFSAEPDNIAPAEDPSAAKDTNSATDDEIKNMLAAMYSTAEEKSTADSADAPAAATEPKPEEPENNSVESNSNTDQSKNSGYGNMKNSLAAIRRRLGK